MLILFFAGWIAVVGDSSAVAAALRRSLSAGHAPPMRWSDLRDVRAAAESLYLRSGWRPLWSEEGRPTAPARAMIGALADVRDRGLDPTDYDAASLAALEGRLDRADTTASAEAVADFDVTLSAAAIRVVSALERGRIAPEELHPGFHPVRPPADPTALVDSLRSTDRPAELLDRLEPQSAEYRTLRRGLARYHALAADSTLVPPRPAHALAPGTGYGDAGRLRRLLLALGDLTPAAGPPPEADTLYDDTLAEGVRRFQRRHGLATDGIAGPVTWDQLTVPFTARTRQLELALERRRWRAVPALPRVLVDIPAFRLSAAWEGARGADSAIEMNVVVGEAREHETPVFTAAMTKLIFRPYWEVPVSIMLREIKPRAEADPEYLDREEMELLEGTTIVPPTPANVARIGGAVRVRQRPGDKNALGRVKFVLPNRYAVFLHDTPARDLFARPRRDFSHGCIRVEEPLALARFGLRDVPEWTDDSTAAATGGETPREVDLPRPIPVLVVYEPVFATPDGELHFRPDLYAEDHRLERRLAAGYPYRTLTR